MIIDMHLFDCEVYYGCPQVQGVPYYWAHFVFCNFSGSGAPTEGLFTISQQPWKFATL